MRNKKASQSPAGTSTAVEDYLERILELINSKGYARVIDIAAALKISQASVTNMVLSGFRFPSKRMPISQ